MLCISFIYHFMNYFAESSIMLEEHRNFIKNKMNNSSDKATYNYTSNNVPGICILNYRICIRLYKDYALF